jgi:hypothetical protein
MRSILDLKAVYCLGTVGLLAGCDLSTSDGATDLAGPLPHHDGGVADASTPPHGGDDAAVASDMAVGGPDMAVAASQVRVVAYLPNYNGSYSDWAMKIDFNKMTHLNLAFATATDTNGWNMGAADQDVQALVNAAHNAGTKVLASLGGGGGDQSVIARYRDPNNIDDLVNKLDQFVGAHNFDGVDVDIEDPNNLGANYSTFVDKTFNRLHPEGKLVTAAVAQYLQGNMSDTTLHEFDFVNVMVYSNYDDGVNAMNYYANTKNVPLLQITLGAAFFGTDNNGNEYAYSDILNADPNAWGYDQTQVRGNTVNYTGMATMKRIAQFSKGYGGIMFWELTEDVMDSHSLYKVIQGVM